MLSFSLKSLPVADEMIQQTGSGGGGGGDDVGLSSSSSLSCSLAPMPRCHRRPSKASWTALLGGLRVTIKRGLFKAACHSMAKLGSCSIKSNSEYCLKLGHHDLNNLFGDFKSSFRLACFKVKFNFFVGF